jgi:Mn-dependent DtxR family transcriptional regulator
LERIPVTKKPCTAKQGQYLAFIFYYAKIHGRAPAESDLQNYFKVSPPSVHQMVLTLESNGFIERVPGQGRSIRLLIPREDLPDLE